MARVLVTDSHEVAALGAVRSLGRAGHKLVLVWPKGAPFPASRASKYASRLVRSPDPWVQQSAYRAWLRNQVEVGGYDAILPISEASILAASFVRREVAAPTFLLPSESALRFSLSKVVASKAAQAAGIPIPRTVFVHETDPLQASETGCTDDPQVLSELRYPLIVKCDNYLTSDGGYRKGSATRVENRGEAAAVLAECRARRCGVLVQEAVPGHGAGVFLLRHQGRTVLRFAHRRLHEVPYSGGYSSFRESCHDERLLALAERLLGAIDYNGVAMVEFRQAEGGESYFLEINGRLWGSLALALHAGVDFPLWLLRSAMGAQAEVFAEEEIRAAGNYPDGVRCRNVIPGELLHLASVIRAPKEDTERPSKRATFARFVSLFFEPSVNYDYLWPKDPLPALAQVAEFGREVVEKSARYVEHKVVRLREEHLLRGMAGRREQLSRVLADKPAGGHKRVLFLCYGNILRSAFCAAYFNQRAQALGLAVVAESAGFHLESGRKVPPRGQAFAREFGVELSGHRSRRVDEVMLGRADVVFVMDGPNLFHLTQEFPEVLSKSFALGMVGARGGTEEGGTDGGPSAIEIADPYHLSVHSAEEIYRKMVACVDRLVQLIQGL